MKRRVAACLLAAALAWFFAKALGVPVWRNFEAGDRVDLTVLAIALVWVLTA